MQPLLERWVVAAVLVAELVAVLGLLAVRCSRAGRRGAHRYKYVNCARGLSVDAF